MTSQLLTREPLDTLSVPNLIASNNEATLVDFCPPQEDRPNHKRPKEYSTLPPLQQELFDADPEYHTARYSILAKLPAPIANFFAKQYQRRLNAYGSQYTIEWFQAKMREMLPRFKLVMNQYSQVLSITNLKSKGDLKWLDDIDYNHADFDPPEEVKEKETEQQRASRIARKVAHCSTVLQPITERLEHTANEIKGLNLQPLCYMRDDQIKSLADTIAFNMGEHMAKFAEKYGEGCDTPQKAYKVLSELYKDLVEQCEIYKIQAPYAQESKRGRLTHTKIETGLLKLGCPKYWERKLDRTAKRMKEHLSIAMGMVSTISGGYVSNWRLNDYKQQKEANLAFIKSCLLVNVANEEEQKELFDVWLKSPSSPKNRRIELMNRLNGYEAIAQERGDIGVFITLTTPSKYHTMSNDQLNPKWNGSSPIDTQKYLCNVGGNIRSALKNRNIKPYGVRIVEPHADATPHWHLMLWTKPEQVRELKRIFWQYALAEDGKEKGAWRHRCTFKMIDPKKGSATGYIAKYISKNIDGCHLQGLEDDEIGGDMRLAAERVQAWATLWGIRQFQFWGGAPVGVYREIRKLGSEKQEDELVEQFRLGVDLGDYAYYTELQGGPMVLRKELKLRTHYTETGETRYKEVRKVVNGIINQLTGDVTITKNKEWKIVQKTTENDQNSDRTLTVEDADRMLEAIARGNKPTQGEALKNGDLSPPWTCVGNCARSKNKQISEEAREKIKNELILMRGRVTDYQIDDFLNGKPLKIYSNERVKVYVEYINGHIVEKKRYEKRI